MQGGLHELLAEKRIESKEGFYFLSGHAEIVERRQLAIPLIDKKLKIAAKAAKRIRWIPFFEALFVCNTVASASATDDSDIDVFIVIRKGRLWITRLLITLTLSFYRMRRHKEHVANKICLSFYVTDAHLNLSDVTIDEPDIYMMYWIVQLIPMYDPINIRENIFKENNWVMPYLPQAFQPYRMHPLFRVEDGGMAKRIKRMFETMWGSGYGDMIEKQAKHAQEKKMAMNFSSVKDEHDTRVVVDDTMLKFHENDRRAYYRDEWRKRVHSNFELLRMSE
ncbi:MAG: hypothetical protein UV82_C0009G0075 [Candidatus Magasanikbacteria bacterium GW2011_GWD2_43_18]|nr:MAG: hypothetical protein UV82_C0009G0075 [Candidatus Magasanikbacteria bacterium GW2011_GWD2_43_18]